MAERLMPVIATELDVSSAEFGANRARMLALLERLRELETRTRAASDRAKKRFDERGALLPRERIGRLLDLGSPWLELSSIAGYLQDDPDPVKSIPGARLGTGIRYA